MSDRQGEQWAREDIRIRRQETAGDRQWEGNAGGELGSGRDR